MLKLTLFLFTSLILLYGYSQVPPAERLTDWSGAGIHKHLSVYQQIPFEGDTTGTHDNSTNLQYIFDTITRPSIILFGKGTFLFTQKIILPSSTILKGLGNLNTRLYFNLSGNREPAIEIIGNQTGPHYTLTQEAFRRQNFITLPPQIAAEWNAGDFLRILQDDSDLINDSWASSRTGQILGIDSIHMDTLFVSSPLRMNYPLSRNPRIRRVIPKQYSGIECLKILRLDNTNSGSGSANIEIRSAANCWISSVESERCNFAHIEVFYSTHLLIEDNYFHDAHSFGSGGRAYGVMLHYATGDVLVQNNIFRRLRHAMILQAGANGNAFTYNYAYQSRKEIFPDFFIPGEDMVCHGNYPYLNIFEGNYAQFASVDNSHGKNGPNNTYFRNIATTAGFRVANDVSPFQNFTANHSVNGAFSFLSSNHHITDNSWQPPTLLSEASLVYSETPTFLAGYGLGKIGPPQYNAKVSIPARDRALSGNYISNKCDVIIWQDGKWQNRLMPSLFTKDYLLKVIDLHPLHLEGQLQLKGIDAAANTTIEVKPGSKIILHQ